MAERDYTARHKQIRNKLRETVRESHCGCFHISQIAAELGMDQRTVKAHLKIIEMSNEGIFLDPKEKEFCTKEGLILLAKKIGLGEIAGEKEES